MAPGARSKFGVRMFEPELFRKQIYCIEESACDIFGTFWRSGNCTPPLPTPRYALYQRKSGTGGSHQIKLTTARGDEPICYRGPLCQLPLSKRAAQLFCQAMKPVKNEKIVHQQKQTTNESNKKFKTAGLA